ncbi:hypothetical protein BCR32DRAFT_284171 [Anaeromyces robustus]|uniref:Uncharacterized protein n=1 Tax=Anaeromyces robustus TaxID=1754192 RepID=A0A1Y1WSI6_9FUNG|nr:hypothetical protein BCR32DRAFT_284171 [Anaeromyces robustus]|eukprot:ORX76412.1 hypothetical protein BCR32DRAFT_284171 [Anaeromyces robustus]
MKNLMIHTVGLTTRSRRNIRPEDLREIYIEGINRQVIREAKNYLKVYYHPSDNINILENYNPAEYKNQENQEISKSDLIRVEQGFFKRINKTLHRKDLPDNVKTYFENIIKTYQFKYIDNKTGEPLLERKINKGKEKEVEVLSGNESSTSTTIFNMKNKNDSSNNNNNDYIMILDSDNGNEDSKINLIYIKEKYPNKNNDNKKKYDILANCANYHLFNIKPSIIKNDVNNKKIKLKWDHVMAIENLKTETIVGPAPFKSDHPKWDQGYVSAVGFKAFLEVKKNYQDMLIEMNDKNMEIEELISIIDNKDMDISQLEIRITNERINILKYEIKEIKEENKKIMENKFINNKLNRIALTRQVYENSKNLNLIMKYLNIKYNLNKHIENNENNEINENNTINENIEIRVKFLMINLLIIWNCMS